MEVSPTNPAVTEPQAVAQKSIDSYFSVQKGTSAHEITPASANLAKAAASSAAKAKEAKTAKDTKVVGKVTAKKASSKAAVEPKANLVVDLDADDKNAKSYIPGASYLRLLHTPHTLLQIRGNILLLLTTCRTCFSIPEVLL